MKRSGVGYCLLILIGFLNFGCSQNNASNERVEQIFKALKENEAKVIISFNGKEFYPAESVFKGQVTLSHQMLSLALTNQFEGKTMLSLGGEKWYAQNPIVKKVDLKDAFNASLKIGKLIDPKNMIGEGYMMTDGQIEAITFAKDQMVFKITGRVGKYSDFEQPDKYISAEGFIVYKMPAINWSNITEDEVFSSTKLDK
ncbi:MAG: hypothetical protein ABIN80_24475 [Dyadobacter sp.]|uniref:hypothetical protein n=1 Tax=Dyadobacter sp. TaxID=1914288 RepID=UPI0032679AEC